jgi:hypothetical protein
MSGACTTVPKSLNTIGTNIYLEHYNYLNQPGATTYYITIFISSIQGNKIVFIQTLVDVKNTVWVCVGSETALNSEWPLQCSTPSYHVKGTRDKTQDIFCNNTLHVLKNL